MWERQGVDAAAVAGSFGADPFGNWAVDRDNERLDAQLQAMLDEARALAAEHPNVRVATIDGTRFHDAGASDAQELGDTLAVVVATLRTLTDGGLDVAAAFGQLEVRLAATVEQFATIAKFRAARRLLARVAEVCRRSDRRRWRAAARRHVTGDDDALRPGRQHRAGDDRLLRRGRRRR